ncbi:lysophospholipase L1-like esterase [Litoreibacter ponti]|uniref:Lysophospholipase L1-like esterase n=1 Tax=Litoreibacter ponti TaxID=1510457 RepID=A0A2T6BI70_9RHOB|nr:SGNH/GDSL hydrolase family protein [Litoreibacter ponti]PTX55755.1 lysophospholipase L1-like esterase [Litoreibacter ponti]
MNNLMRGLLLSLALLGMSASAQAKQDILVIGDSMLEWQKIFNASIPDVLARETERAVDNRAASGAKFYLSGAGTNPRSVIPAQYEAGDWNWVLVNGGANDLLTKCGCRKCDAVLDRLISRDGQRGIVPDLVRKIRADGPRVMMVAYYEGNARRNLFSRCAAPLREMVQRQLKLARAERGIEMVRIKSAINPKNRSHFAIDGIHLSRKGTNRVGILLARTLEMLEKRGS